MEKLEKMAKELEEMLGCECRVAQKQKNNAVLTGIEVHSDADNALMIFPKEGDTAQNLYKDIQKRLQQVEEFAKGMLSKFDSNIRIGLTENEEYVEEFVHRKVADLYAFLYLVEQGEDEHAIMKLRPCNLEMVGVSEEEAFEKAKVNMMKNAYVGTMMNAVMGVSNIMDMPRCEVSDRLLEEDYQPMVVIRGRENDYGAAYALVPEVHYVLERLYPNGYWIMPSSVYEMLVMPKCFGCVSMKLEEAYEMVRNANSNPFVISPEDVLSNSVYEWENEEFVVAEL